MRAPIAPKTATSCSNAPAGPTTRLGIADAGERDPVELAALRHGRCKKSHEEFAEYLTGNWREEHRFNLESALKLYDAIQQRIASYEARLLNELHARVKAGCALEGKGITQVLVELLEKRFPSK